MYLTLGLCLFLGGMLIGLVSFIVAARNMGTSMSLRRHTNTMIPMAVGGMSCAAGVVFLIIWAVEKFAS